MAGTQVFKGEKTDSIEKEGEFLGRNVGKPYMEKVFSGVTSLPFAYCPEERTSQQKFSSKTKHGFANRVWSIATHQYHDKAWSILVAQACMPSLSTWRLRKPCVFIRYSVAKALSVPWWQYTTTGL